MKNKLKKLLYSVLALAALTSSFALFICSLFDIYDFRCNNEIKDGINAIFRLILSISVNRTATEFNEKLDELEDSK